MSRKKRGQTKKNIPCEVCNERNLLEGEITLLEPPEAGRCPLGTQWRGIGHRRGNSGNTCSVHRHPSASDFRMKT